MLFFSGITRRTDDNRPLILRVRRGHSGELSVRATILQPATDRVLRFFRKVPKARFSEFKSAGLFDQIFP